MSWLSDRMKEVPSFRDSLVSLVLNISFHTSKIQLTLTWFEVLSSLVQGVAILEILGKRHFFLLFSIGLES